MARSIEKVFNERLHEFYGMLALHYIKGEDFEKAEHYLVKAGEEAMRSSASGEALNYYQEGLKLYLQLNKDAADPERLAMFEKNIANVLYSKGRWFDAVKHINKFFEYSNTSVSPNKLYILFKFIKNLVFVLATGDRLFKKEKPIPSKKDNEFFDLMYKRSSASVYFDNTQMLFDALRSFNSIVKLDITKSTGAFNIVIGTAGLLLLVIYLKKFHANF